MKPYFQVLIWIILGTTLGITIFLLTNPTPIQPPSNLNLSVEINSSQLQNQTPPKKSPVNLTLIVAPCEECNYGEIAIEQTKTILSNSSNLSLGSVKTLAYPSTEANALIAKYNITELPVLIVTGNSSADASLVSIWKTNAGTQESDGSLVSRYLYPPFYDLEKGRPAGFVSAIIIEANCTICSNANNFTAPLESELFGVVFTNKTVLSETDPLAQNLIEKYSIEKLPAVLFNEDIFVYPVGKQFLSFGTVEDGWFILRDVWPPYIELPSHKIRGQVEAIYISNSSCSDCFDVTELNRYIIESTGLKVNTETSYELNSTEASSLISKYNLTKIPALLYSPEAAVYPSFEEIWAYENNTVEDGWFVFRAYEFVDGPYQTIN